MIKCEVTDKYTKMTAVGDIPTLGADLTHIFHGLLSEMPEKVKHEFMLSFMMAFDSGLIFDTDSKGMRKLYDELWEYLDLKDEDKDEDEEDESDEDSEASASKAIDGLLDVLIKARDEIKSLREKMEDIKNETK